MKYFASLVLASSIIMTTSTNAAVIRVGNLITDDTSFFMEDVTTGRLYSRVNATVGRTYEQLTTIDMLSGGNWDGWSIATSQVSDDLINALLGVTSPCTGAVDNGSTCGTMTDGIARVLGGEIDMYSDEYWSYISTYDTPNMGEDDLGAVFLLFVGIFDYDDNTSIKRVSDSQTMYGSTTISYMMYKDVVVTEPSNLAIFTLGMIGLVLRRFKKQF